MYQRDFLILVLAAFLVYFTLQNEGPFSFRRAWCGHCPTDSDWSATDGLSRYYPLTAEDSSIFSSNEILPKPVVVDLNGDGSLETVLVTHDHRLIVLRGRGVGHYGDGFALAQTMADVSLRPSGFHILSGHRPVGLAAGFIDPPANDMVHRHRKAVIVVVTENWHVTCYDHNLVKLWEHDVHKEMHSHATIHELAILITHHSVYQSDRGLVVVGGSMNIASLMEEEMADDVDPFRTEREEEEKEENIRHRMEDNAKQADLDDDQTYGADTSRHFSYYAFDGGSGARRWTQTGSEFKHDLQSLKDDLMPQRYYKVEAEHLTSMDYSEVSCRDYRESILHNLPHQWLHRVDTQLILSHFEKHKYGKGERKKHLANSEKKTSSSKSSCAGEKCEKDAVAKVLGKVSEKAASDGRRPTNDTRPPNAIVAHLKEGIEAIHLYTGRSICKLHLPQGGLHVDLNGDGVLDHIQVVTGGEIVHSEGGHHRMAECTVYATSGVPPQEPYFNVSACSAANAWNKPFAHSGRASGSRSGRHHVDVAAPAFLPIPTPRGEWSFRYGQRGMSLFLNSRGEVTAINSRGHMKWRVSTECTWSTEGVRYRNPHPTLKAFSLRTHAFPSGILAAGSHDAAVLSEHGNLLTSFTLSDIPVLPLEIVDLNGDGLNDVLLISNRIVYGYIQVQNLGGRPFAMLVLCLIVAMGTIYAAQYTGSEASKKIKRSTDRTD